MAELYRVLSPHVDLLDWRDNLSAYIISIDINIMRNGQGHRQTN